MHHQPGRVYTFTRPAYDPIHLLQKRVRASIRRFAERPGKAAAVAVVESLGRLCHHPANGLDTPTRCALLRLRAHWRMVAFCTPGN